MAKCCEKKKDHVEWRKLRKALCPSSSSCTVTVSTFTSCLLPVTSCFDSLVPLGMLCRERKWEERKVQSPVCVYICVCMCVFSVSVYKFCTLAWKRTSKEWTIVSFDGNFLPILQVIRANHLSFSYWNFVSGYFLPSPPPPSCKPLSSSSSSSFRDGAILQAIIRFDFVPFTFFSSSFFFNVFFYFFLLVKLLSWLTLFLRPFTLFSGNHFRIWS